MEMNSPKVTIITGYYNRKENLLESVESVLDQTYDNFEYLVFDDCSTDGTVELLSSFEGHPKFKLIRHNVNLGLTKGLIAAVAQAKGKYIAIHGAGDLSFPDRIQKQVSLFEARPELSLVGCIVEDSHGNDIDLLNEKGKGKHLHFTHGEVMYPKELYYRAGGYNSYFKMGQFTGLKFELKKLGDVDIVPEILYRRIHFDNGITKNKSKRISQKIYINLGESIAKHGFLNVSHSDVILDTMISLISLYDFNANEISLLKLHLKRKSYFLYFLYYLYQKKLLPEKVYRNSSLLILRKLSNK